MKQLKTHIKHLSIFKRSYFSQTVLLITGLVSTLSCLTGQAQTLSITDATLSYSIHGDYTPSGSPAESIHFSDTLNLLSQPSFEMSTSPWGGDMSVDFDFTRGTATGFSFSFYGRSQFGIGNPASFDVAAATTFNYSILFELDSPALMDFGMAHNGMSTPGLYSPFSPTRDASASLEYLGLSGWEEVVSRDGVSFGVPAIDFYQTLSSGTYRLSGSGVTHAASLGVHSGITISPAPVPAPSAALLAALAGLMLTLPRRRKTLVA